MVLSLLFISVFTSADDDIIDVDSLHDDELQLYFNKLIPPAMQRGRVEGQEIPAAVRFWCTQVGCPTAHNFLLNFFSVYCSTLMTYLMRALKD